MMRSRCTRTEGQYGRARPALSTRALKVTGEARYPADMPVSNPAFAYLVTSAIAKGRIERLDLDDGARGAGRARHPDA